MEDLKKWIKSYPDFPSKGILFRDISPLLAEPKALSLLKDRFIETIKPLNADYVAGIDARGFLFCTLVAENLGLGALICLLYTSPSPRDRQKSRMPSSA